MIDRPFLIHRWFVVVVFAYLALVNPSLFAQSDFNSIGVMSTTLGLNDSQSAGISARDTLPQTPVIRTNDLGSDRKEAVENILVTSKKEALPPNEFQNFIKDSTGQNLSLFGADFFAGNANSFSTQTNTPVSADYRIGPGDEIHIKGWGSVDIDVQTVVDRNGLIHIPRVGSVNLLGVKSSQAEATIRTAISRYYRDFQLSVTQGKLRGMTIYVVGQARQPGAYLLSGASTLVSALFASGGPSQFGSLRRVQVKRGERIVTELDLYDFIAFGDKSADIKLQDGDTIVIPPALGYVALIGKVAVPAVYELDSSKDSIASLLTIAGGLPVVADPKRAYLERVDPSKKPSRSVEAFALDADSIKKKLRNGDVLTVVPISYEFSNAVTLRGSVEQPVRMPWRKGMKVQDLIPDKSLLISRASVKRQNAVLNRSQDIASLASGIGQLVDEINWDYAVVERINAQKIDMQLIPFNLGRALSDAGSTDNLPLEPGDVITVFSIDDMRVPQAQRQAFVRIEGEVARPGVYQMKSGDGLLELIKTAGGLTPQAYLFGAQFYREQVKQTQQKNLTKLIEQLEVQFQNRSNTAFGEGAGSTSEAIQAGLLRKQVEDQNQKRALQRLSSLKPTGRVMLGISPEPKQQRLPQLKIENQDHLVIPSKPDFVYVIGSVSTESAIIWQPGKTARHYMALSGLTEGTDEDEAIILRPDGSVLSKSSMGWVSSVAGVKVLPGDTIVLQDKVIKESAFGAFTRNAKDLTQIIYQFSLGAAAIKTLRE